MSFSIGDRVEVEDFGMGTVISTLKHTAKVDIDGVSRTYPHSLMKLVKKDEHSAPPDSTENNSVKTEDNNTYEIPAAETPKPATSRKRAAKQPKLVPAETVAPVEKKKHTPPDEVAKLLADCNTKQAMYKAVKTHKCAEFLNSEALTALYKCMSTLGDGLVRMRLGNLLRGAIARSKK